MVAETVAILAGASPLSWGLAALAALAGNLPAALLYALTGAYANEVASASLMFGLVLLLTGVFWLGRKGGTLLGRMVRPEERARADRLLKRWGAMAIVLTRPIPMVAETVAILAGASPLRWGLVALAALAGNLPAALLYALTGAYANDFASASLMFGLVILLTGVFWLIGRRLGSGADAPGEG